MKTKPTTNRTVKTDPTKQTILKPFFITPIERDVLLVGLRLTAAEFLPWEMAIAQALVVKLEAHK